MRMLAVACAAILAAMPNLAPAQTWTPLTNPTPDGIQAYRMRLLTDGTVMAQNGTSRNWLRLTPDATGSYINGTWSTTSIAPMSTNRFSFPSEVLQSGKVWILGGENYGPNDDDVWTATGEQWNPTTNKWSAIATFPDQACFAVTYNVTAATTAGSTSIKQIPSVVTPTFVVGWTVAGPGIPAGATITSINSKTMVQVSPAATATQKVVTLQFSGTPKSCYGDVPTMLLPGGKILAGSLVGPASYLYTIAKNSWAFAATKVYNDSSDEEGWARLADGRIITYDIGPSVSSGNSVAELYNPTTNSWASISPSDGTATGTFPLLSSSAVDYELGPSLRLQDGRMFLVGATGHTALYTPSTNSWAAGPDIIGSLNGNPALFGADDAPAALMPNGHVLLGADAGPTSGAYSAPSELFDFDPVAGTMSPVSPAIDDTFLPTESIYNASMLMLPTGQVIFADGSYQLWVYTPAGTVNPAYQPVITKIKFDHAGLFTVTGTQLTGPSAGASYGDDAEMDENFPVVRLVAADGTTFYCPTMNWSSVGVGGPTAPQTVEFTLNPGVTAGTYTVILSAAGVSSAPSTITVNAAEIP